VNIVVVKPEANTSNANSVVHRSLNDMQKNTRNQHTLTMDLLEFRDIRFTNCGCQGEYEMIVKDETTGEMYSNLFVHWLPSNYIDRKNAMRECALVIYQTRLFLKSVDMNEEDYPIDWN
jgi:hypothetical protein